MTARLPTKNKKSKRKTGVAPGLRRHGLGLRARRRAALAAMKAKALGFELGDVSIKLQKIMQASPRKVSEIVMSFDWAGLDQKISAEDLQALKEAALNCPVALSLDPSVKKRMNW